MVKVKCQLCSDKGYLVFVTKKGTVKKVPCTHWLPADYVRKWDDYED